jgi:putative Holliday junction resolvase
LARIIAIDYGAKRTGIAVTDPLQIIATALETVATENLLDFLDRYCRQEEVESFVIGHPLNHDGSETHASPLVAGFAKELKEKFPEKKIHFVDEAYTSKLAMRTLIASGVKKKERRQKGALDKVAATIILQDFMENRGI